MITGTIELNLKEGTNIEQLLEEIAEDLCIEENEMKEMFGINETDGTKVLITYESKYPDTASEILERDAVESGFADLEDDGEKSCCPGSFAYLKKYGGQVETEDPVYLSQVSSEKLMAELQNRGYKISKDHSKNIEERG